MCRRNCVNVQTLVAHVLYTKKVKNIESCDIVSKSSSWLAHVLYTKKVRNIKGRDIVCWCKYVYQLTQLFNWAQVVYKLHPKVTWRKNAARFWQEKKGDFSFVEQSWDVHRIPKHVEHLLSTVPSWQMILGIVQFCVAPIWASTTIKTQIICHSLLFQ